MFSFQNKENRIFYNSSKFTEGLTVTGYFILPDDGVSKTDVFTFTELGDGIYYLDYTYTMIGKHSLVVKENGEVKSFDTIKVG